MPIGLTIVAAVALVSLVASAFSGWYVINYTLRRGFCCADTLNETFYLYDRTSGTDRFAGGPFGFHDSPMNVSGLPGPHTLQLYGGVIVGLLGAMATSIAGMIIRARSHRDSVKWHSLGVALVACSAALSLAGPIALVFLQPGALVQDGRVPAGPSPSPSPGTSFFGLCSSPFACSSPPPADGWGPSTGWYLSLFAGIVLAGLALMMVYRLRHPISPQSDP